MGLRFIFRAPEVCGNQLAIETLKQSWVSQIRKIIRRMKITPENLLSVPTLPFVFTIFDSHLSGAAISEHTA